MKKVFTILMVLCVLLGMSGCSSRKTFKTEDYEVYDIISDLDELKKSAEEDGVVMDYDITRGFDGKYTIKIVLEFGEHKSEWKSCPFTMDEFNNEFDNLEPDDVFTFKVDGVKYDYDTAMLLLEHYSGGMID